MKTSVVCALALLTLATFLGPQRTSARAAGSAPRSFDRLDRQDKNKNANPAPDASSVVGRWHLSVGAPGFTNRSLLELQSDAKDKDKKKLTGTLFGTQVGEIPIKGEFSKGKLKFSVEIDIGENSIFIDFEGKLKDDGTIAGTAYVGQLGTIEWTARRVEEK